MVATHDPRLVAIAGALAVKDRRTPGTLRVPDALRHPARRAAPAGRRRRDGAGLRALRRRVVRLPDAAAGRAPGEPRRSSCASLADAGADRGGRTGRDPRRRQDGRDAALRRCCAPGCAAGRPRRQPSGRPERAAALARALRRRGRSTTPTRGRVADTLLLAVKPQDMAALLDELAAHVPAGRAGGLARGRASRPRSSRQRLPDGHAGRAGHAQHARRSSTRRWRRSARARTATRSTCAEAEALLAAVGKVVRRARVAAGRRHGDQRQRPGVLLLPRRGHDRRRHPARAAARDVAPSSSSRPLYGAATMLRETGRAPDVLREQRHVSPAGTTIAALRAARGPRGAGGVPRRARGGPRPLARARRRLVTDAVTRPLRLRLGRRLPRAYDFGPTHPLRAAAPRAHDAARARRSACSTGPDVAVARPEPAGDDDLLDRCTTPRTSTRSRRASGRPAGADLRRGLGTDGHTRSSRGMHEASALSCGATRRGRARRLGRRGRSTPSTSPAACTTPCRPAPAGSASTTTPPSRSAWLLEAGCRAGRLRRRRRPPRRRRRGASGTTRAC